MKQNNPKKDETEFKKAYVLNIEELSDEELIENIDILTVAKDEMHLNFVRAEAMNRNIYIYNLFTILWASACSRVTLGAQDSFKIFILFTVGTIAEYLYREAKASEYFNQERNADMEIIRQQRNMIKRIENERSRSR